MATYGTLVRITQQVTGIHLNKAQHSSPVIEVCVVASHLSARETKAGDLEAQSQRGLKTKPKHRIPSS